MNCSLKQDIQKQNTAVKKWSLNLNKKLKMSLSGTTHQWEYEMHAAGWLMQESVTADRKETSAAWQGSSAVVESWREIYAARTKHTQERFKHKTEGQTAVAEL